MADPKAMTTGECRLSYLRAFKPHARPGEDPKYSVTILVPKNDFSTKQKLDSAIQAAIAEGVAEKWNGVRPPILAIPLYDGDGVRPSDGMPFGEECKGHWVFSASTKEQPKVVDLAVQPILNQSDVYSGMYGRVSVRFFPYLSNGKKGIGVGLSNIQKTRDGEPLGGRTSAEQDFADSAQFAQQVGVAQSYHTPQPQYTPTPQGIPAYNPMPQYTPQYTPNPAPAQQPAQYGVDPITGMPYKPFGI